MNRTRRRPFIGMGRYPESLQSATAELNLEGNDDILLPDHPAPRPPILATLESLLAASPTLLTCRELLERRASPPRAQNRACAPPPAVFILTDFDHWSSCVPGSEGFRWPDAVANSLSDR
jgi:hypothetical protein